MLELMDTATPVLTTKVMDLLLDTVCVVDAQGCFVFASASCEQVFGYTPEELRGRDMVSMIHPDDRERTLEAASKVMAGHALTHFENRYLRKDGGVVHIMWSARWSPDDRLRIAVARDVTARKRAESVQAALYAISEAAHSAEDLLTLFQRIHQIIGQLLPAKNFFVALYDELRNELSFPYHVDEHDTPPEPGPLESGTLSAEVIRTGRTLLVTPESAPDLPSHLSQVIGAESSYWLGVPLSSQRGTFGALVVQSYGSGAHYSEQDQELLQFVSAQIAAAIERKRMHARLQHIALYDQLTDLPNRELLTDRLRASMARTRREDGMLSLLYIDLDGFKQVNDSLGHEAGDRLLEAVAARLTWCVRGSDTVARIGGDEFVVLLEGLHRAEDALRIAEKIRRALGEPLDLAGLHTAISSSIGIAMYPGDGDSEQALLRYADEAMYAAKRSGGNQCRAAAGTG
jgi:diguanylate cyclase (GGDEF)-like protein/PAS domain S-box-containing protein